MKEIDKNVVKDKKTRRANDPFLTYRVCHLTDATECAQTESLYLYVRCIMRAS